VLSDLPHGQKSGRPKAENRVITFDSNA